MNRIGKYELKGTLGKGASATVYLATDTFTNADVAVKVINPEALKDPEQGKIIRTQFLNEASLAGRLNHPHIAAILDAVVDGDSGYIAMEYVPGGNLTPRTKPQNLFPIEDAVQVGFKCCGALDYAFRQGVVHRDVKPANIMVVKDTDIKITDFGAAFLRRSDATAVTNLGSPAYMAPEQISGATLTHQSDMFALGVVLYELLTGRRPFIADTVPGTLEKIMSDNPAPPSSLREGLPAELDRIVLTALSKSAASRFATWADFALELVKVGKLSVYQQTIRDSEKYEALRRVAMLKVLDDGQIWELVRAARWQRLPPQSAIIRENEPGASLFFLAKGQAKATRQGRPLNLIEAGECFGEMGYIRGGELPRHATIESLTEVVCAEFQGAAIEKTSAACQLHFTRALVRTLVERLELANTRIAQAAKA